MEFCYPTTGLARKCIDCYSPLFAFSASGTVSKPKCVLLSSLKQRQDAVPQQQPDRPETPAAVALKFLWERRITLFTRSLMDAAMLADYTILRQSVVIHRRRCSFSWLEKNDRRCLGIKTITAKSLLNHTENQSRVVKTAREFITAPGLQQC